MMLPLFLFSTAWRSLSQHKGRSLLTTLSIIIGIAAVIATLGIGRGAQENIRRRIASFGSNVLRIYAGGVAQSGSTTLTKKKRTRWLTQQDAAYFLQACPTIRYVASSCRTGDKIISYHNRRILAPIESCDADHLRLSNRTLAFGRQFTPQEVLQNKYVCILGAKAAQELFRGASALHQTIIIDRKPFVVIGILTETENFHSFSDRNLEVYVPLNTGRKMFHSNIPAEGVHSINVAGYSTDDLAKIERFLRRALRMRHKLLSSDPDDFSVWNQASMNKAAEQSSQTFNLFLLIVASLSLLVGGIGVSNIMLVTVTERTKEIGIRLALGAPPALVLIQFLIESILLCGVGGFFGIFLGVGIPYLVSLFTGWLVIITPFSILITLFITLFIGILFGFWPAYRASRMNIVEALHDQ